MSKEEKPIHYEPHPVSPERKAELVAKGVRIIDAIFDPNPKPAKAEKPAEPEAGQKPAEGEQPKHEGEAPKE